MAILVKGYILPIGGVASGRVCACSLRSRIVFFLQRGADNQWRVCYKQGILHLLLVLLLAKHQTLRKGTGDVHVLMVGTYP